MKRLIYASLLVLCLPATSLRSQNTHFVSHPDQLNDEKFAEWIVPGETEGVFYFRKKLKLESIPDSFIVYVSGDTHYRLYVNEKLVLWGPAANDLVNWNYETVDLSPYLKKGENIIASQVWNMGELNGTRQISHKTAFILQSNNEKQKEINTNKTWLVKKDNAYSFLKMDNKTVGGGYIAGGTEKLDGHKHTWGWNQLNFNDADWRPAKEFGKGNHSGLDTWIMTPWYLKARELPEMEQKKEKIKTLLSVQGINYNVQDYNENMNITIPANSKVEILLDNEVLTMGFPKLELAKGNGSSIKIQYQEALFNQNGQKGNRNEWQGKEFKGYYDIYLHDGGEREFQPLWVRVFRYVKLTIETGEEPLQLKKFYNIFTAYPFKLKGEFRSDDKSLQDIWEVAWRTARLCALETYMDCPYYEQLQYIGDTRIQALISMYVTNDDRLARNAIKQFYNSLQPMGLTQSRYPTNEVQIIPPFTLLFIGMVHDYFMLRDDNEFVQQFMPGIRFMLDWFVNKIDDTGMLGPIPYWNHIDGGTKFRAGSPPGISEGGSAHMSILLAYAIERATEMFDYYGYKCDSENYKNISASLKKRTQELCFDPEKGLIAETPKKEQFSQHTNSFAILTDMFKNEEAKQLATKIITDESLIQATLYFNFYVFQALKKAGMGSEVIRQMDKWKTFLDYGFTTFPEHGISSRSDCHAWSSHPMYDFLNITCGIEPTEPGFKSVIIKPQMGELQKINGVMLHPLGEISVKIDKTKNIGEIILPEGLTGRFILNDKAFELTEGMNTFKPLE